MSERARQQQSRLLGIGATISASGAGILIYAIIKCFAMAYFNHYYYINLCECSLGASLLVLGLCCTLVSGRLGTTAESANNGRIVSTVSVKEGIGKCPVSEAPFIGGVSNTAAIPDYYLGDEAVPW
eukprot:scpid101800/ scgid20688/ 